MVEQAGLLGENRLAHCTGPHAKIGAHLLRLWVGVHVLPQRSFVDVVFTADPANMLSARGSFRSCRSCKDDGQMTGVLVWLLTLHGGLVHWYAASVVSRSNQRWTRVAL